MRFSRATLVMALAVAVLAAACSTSGVTSSAPATTGSAPTSTTTGRPPNIVFLLTDDLDAAELEYMPHVKELIGGAGASFSNYFVNVSLCCPSRTTTLRGQYSHNSGVLTNGGTNGGFETAYQLGIEKDTIATTLQSAGYQTALFGKYLNGYPRTAGDTYIPPGWNEWDSAVKGNAYGEFNYTLNENGKLVNYGRKPEDYGTDVYVNKAANFIQTSAQQGKPFFEYLAVYAPHGPATPAPRHANLFPDARAPRTPDYNEADVSDKPAYISERPPLTDQQQKNTDALYRKRLQSLQAVDEGVVKLVDQLKASGQLDNTYFVFASDNGFHLGQHRLAQGKQTPYEEDIRLPFLVRGPGINAGTTVDALVGNVDLSPTFAAMAGVQPPAFTDGRSLLPLATGKPGATDGWRQSYLLEHWTEKSTGTTPTTKQQEETGIGADGVQTEPPDGDQEDVAPGGGGGRRSKAAVSGIPEFQGIRTAKYTYIEYETGEKELYDIAADPYELDNKAATADPALLDSLHARLDDLRTCKTQGCRDLEAKPI